MDRRLNALAFLSAALLACSPAPPLNFTGDTGPRSDAADDGGGACTAGRIFCSGNRAYTCDNLGNPTNERTCMGEQTCVQGLGCRVCRPMSTRCGPGSSQQIQTCSDDGMRWIDGVTCDTGSGMSCVGGACMDRCSESAQGRSYLGCDYWPTVLPNSQLDSGFEYAVVLANPQTYPVRVTVTGGALTTPIDRNLAAGAVDTVILPWVDNLIQFDRRWGGCRGPEDPACFPAPQGTRPAAPRARSILREGGAYHVHANGPIAAYQFNPLNFERAGGRRSFTNDASLLLPQGVLTERYIVSTYANLAGGTVTSGGFVSIVGVGNDESPTDITVRLTSAISDGPGVRAAAAGSTQNYRIRPGDVLQLVGNGMGDLTGSVISASRPVAVFVGHDCTIVPYQDSRPACDHLEEQLLPNQTWGREYVVSALRNRAARSGPSTAREAAVIRVVSQAADNAISFDPPLAGVTSPAMLQAGQMLEFRTDRDFRVTGTGAFLVTQFMFGQGNDISGGGGDPAMVIEVPSEQFRTNYDFFVPSTYTTNFVNIVAPMGATISMDGNPITEPSTPVGNFQVIRMRVNPGTHHIQSAGDQQFGIKVYGIAIYTSYMYPGGMDLRRITPG